MFDKHLTLLQISDRGLVITFNIFKHTSYCLGGVNTWIAFLVTTMTLD